MKKRSYFNLIDQINCDGKRIKIKGKTKLTQTEDSNSNDLRLPLNCKNIYQAMLATQPQVCDANADGHTKDYVTFLSSTPQVGAVKIQADSNETYVVSYNATLNKLTTGAPPIASAENVDYEEIVVSGLQADGKFRFQFIETALLDINNRIKKGTESSHITWIIFNSDKIYTPDNADLDHFETTAANLDICLLLMENNDQFINYINYKEKNGKTNKRELTKVSYMSIFGHGVTGLLVGDEGNQLCFGYHLGKIYDDYGMENSLRFRQTDINRINPDSFRRFNNETFFYTCNTGTADKNGERFAQLWANRTVGITHAFQNARSNYTFINDTMDIIDGEYNLPWGLPDFSVSDGINGWNDEHGKETSDEWKEKKDRKKDRQKLDANYKKIGYSDKGSLHYPLIDDIADDMDLISKTLGQPRGFMTYTYTIYVDPSYGENIYA